MLCPSTTGSNLLNTLGEYYRVAKEADRAEAAFEVTFKISSASYLRLP